MSGAVLSWRAWRSWQAAVAVAGSWQQRLWLMLYGWGTVGLCYEFSRLLQGPGTPLPETALDRLLPYDPAAVWCYLAFFVYIPWAFAAAPAQRLRWLSRSMQWAGAVSAAIYIAWPTTVLSPALPTPSAPQANAPGTGLGAALLQALLQVDTPQNCLPSLHAALTLLCGLALWDGRRAASRCRSVLALGVGAAICLSIVVLRRHVSVDLAAGLLTGGLCGAGVRWQWSQAQKEPWRRAGT